MRDSVIVLIALLIVSYGSTAQISKDNIVEVVLLAGQSNMAGAGNYDELDDATKQRIENVSNRVSLSFNGKPAKPLSYYDNKPSKKHQFLKRFGPELLLGVTLAEKNPSKEYLLIKRSQGGTALYGAWNPNWTAEKAKAVEKEKKQNIKLYSLHIADIKENLKQLKEQGKSYEVIGMAWMQGENDAAKEVSATTYEDNLKNLINSYRTEFKVEKMPFVMGQINSNYGRFKAGPDMVRTSMVNVANSDENVEVIKTTTDRSWSDYPKHTDNVHYNAEGQKRLGIAFANKLNGIPSVLMNNELLEKQAKEKIIELEKLIKKAEKKKIDVLKEKTTVRTAEIFLKFANWDEKNQEINKDYFEKVKIYKESSALKASDLANFERKEVILMLDEASEYLQLLIDKKVFRKPAPNVDWTKLTVEKDQITYKNRPVFLADYTWKPEVKELTQYHGNLDGFFITPPYVVNEEGDINSKKLKSLKEKKDGSLGFIFMNHKGVPKWSKEKYGPNFSMREDTYTAYDIDNPGARELQSKLLGAVVQYMAGNKYSQLGYMLCNEPHFYTQKTGDKIAWASGPVSNFTKDKFKVWLTEKHTFIKELNNLWETDFSSFNDVSIEIPIDTSLRGTAMWYDWSLFNMYRVTEWYKFLKEEVLKYDSEAKVHLKIMPNLWTENQRVHGIDLETLTDLSGIIGNDSGADHTRMWGPEYEWEKHYGFEWRELCMGYDFMKSVSPNKINFNSELHYLSTGRSRDLYLSPEYTRATFWLAHSYGMTASQIWYWPRKEDGSVPKKAGKGYAGSNNQQPRVTNEVATTIIDLNTFSEEIMAMQRQRKSIRLFYSKTSAINKEKHMDDIYHLYEALHFEGTPLGFVTKDIINKQDNSNWDVVLVYKTPFTTKEELKTVQSYLNNGGTVIIDGASLKTNEYGKELPKLTKGKGTLIELEAVSEIKLKALSILESNNLLPEVSLTETNKLGVKGCIWKVVKNKEGNNVLSVVNVGKTDATLKIELKGATNTICKDLLKGIEVSSNPTLKPNEVFFVEVKESK